MPSGKYFQEKYGSSSTCHRRFQEWIASDIVCSIIILDTSDPGMPLNKSWHEYNESLIERGRILMDISLLRSAKSEIKNMNKGKVGAPFEYSSTYIQLLAFLKIGFKISYRTVQ